ncbi:MAG: hypothetical protein V1901_04365 [Patescibacteria group bacterium]
MEKLLLTIYMASAIEHSKEVCSGKKEDWKVEVKEQLKNPLIGIYDPVARESQKTGKQSGEQVNYITRLKQGGAWAQFHKEMGLIWWGDIKADTDKIQIMIALRNRFLIDGNEMRDLNFWADIEAVIRSNFIFVYMEKNVKTVGTIREITYAELFNIPIYLILPDQTKTDANSTLIDMTIKSGGQIFYSTKDALKFVKERYNI